MNRSENGPQITCSRIFDPWVDHGIRPSCCWHSASAQQRIGCRRATCELYSCVGRVPRNIISSPIWIDRVADLDLTAAIYFYNPLLVTNRLVDNRFVVVDIIDFHDFQLYRYNWFFNFYRYYSNCVFADFQYSLESRFSQ